MNITGHQKEILEKLSKVVQIDNAFVAQETRLTNLLNDLDKKQQSFITRSNEIHRLASARFDEINQIQGELQRLIDEKIKAFPWLATAISDYLHLRDEKIAEFLIRKKNPAPISAEKVREISKEKRTLTRQLLMARYQIKFYESMFPFITEFNDESIDEQLLSAISESQQDDESPNEDPVKSFLAPGEWANLSSAERNQRALERYLKMRIKSSYRLGRDYERYVGYLYENMGYKVDYYGIKEGFDDLGRDLICKRKGETRIVQCKYWASHKEIHENHINQLFGTTVKFYIDNVANQEAFFSSSLFPELLHQGNIKPVIYTSTKLSDTAKKFALALGVEIIENQPLRDYPLIKCHINKQTGEKIYHLPFDQMYDRTILESKAGEFYASTCLEAEAKGFRRAWRWKGD